MIFCINFIAAGRVIISGNIENIGHDFSNGSRLFGFGSFIDESAHFVHHDIEKFRGWSIIHSSGTTVFDFAVFVCAINTFFTFSHCCEHQVDPGCDRACVILCMAEFSHDTGLFLSGCKAKFCNLVSNRVHHNRRMVIVF